MRDKTIGPTYLKDNIQYRKFYITVQYTAHWLSPIYSPIHGRNIEFLILVVKRLSLDERGNLTINQKRIEITDLSLQATYGVSIKFKPIAVIYHSGNVVGKDTRGHYMADVLDFKTNQWIRTSDDDTPKAVLQPSNQGYIYLFKKVV